MLGNSKSCKTCKALKTVNSYRPVRWWNFLSQGVLVMLISMVFICAALCVGDVVSSEINPSLIHARISNANKLLFCQCKLLIYFFKSQPHFFLPPLLPVPHCLPSDTHHLLLYFSSEKNRNKDLPQLSTKYILLSCSKNKHPTLY